ncbi:MAG: glycosyltransferase family 1 protein [Phycisphaerales bacterium]|jgi:glycosyltransferase involved in cell wall biosynthesis
MLFTDTLGDVNGVARFIRNAAACAHATGAELQVVTSTNFEIPEAPNIRNFEPVAARPMPKYPNLEIVWPPRGDMLRAAREFRPDVIHVSTPGSVGLIGRTAAKQMGVPLVGVYHTDFPAYVERLFGHESLTSVTAQTMRWFYRPFDVVLARSKAYAAELGWLAARRLETFKPGIVLEDFASTHRDEAALEAIGSAPGAVRAVFVGRVSVEKNTPLLEQAWLMARPRLQAMGVNAELVIIGDGPDLARLRGTLAHQGVVFAGFRKGLELARLYASCDLLVFPSITDTLGQVVLEAQASGLPVLVTSVGGPSEVMRHGVSGMVLPPNERAWAAALVEILSNHAKRREMAAAALATAREFAFEHSFEAWWDVHKGVMRARAMVGS